METYKPMQYLKKVTNNTEVKSTFYVRLNLKETLSKGRDIPLVGNTKTFQYWVTPCDNEIPIYDYSGENFLEYEADFLITIEIKDKNGNLLGKVTNNTTHAE